MSGSDEVDLGVVTNRLLGALLARDLPLPEGAPLLARIGLANSEIAAIYAAPEPTIRSAVSRGRKKAK